MSAYRLCILGNSLTEFCTKIEDTLRSREIRHTAAFSRTVQSANVKINIIRRVATVPVPFCMALNTSCENTLRGET